MKPSIISVEYLDRMTDGNLTELEILFITYLPCFQECGPFLDISDSTSKTAVAARFPNWEEHLEKAIESGLYLETERRGVYIQSRYFAENARTRSYQRNQRYNALAVGFFVSRWDLSIAKGQTEGSGTLVDFLTLWEGDFKFDANGFGQRRNNRYTKTVSMEWENPSSQMKGDLGNRNGNGNRNSNGNSNVNSNGNPVIKPDITRYKQSSFCQTLVESGYIDESDLQDSQWDDLLNSYVEDHGYEDVKIKIKYFIYHAQGFHQVQVGTTFVSRFRPYDDESIANKYSYFKTTMETAFDRDIQGQADRMEQWAAETRVRYEDDDDLF